MKIAKFNLALAVISLGYRAGEPRQPEHRPLEEIAQFF